MTPSSRLAAAACAALSSACLAPAQAPTPPPELRQLQPFVGNWSGGGTATMDPSRGPGKWTGKATYRWVLDGFFLQEDFLVSFEGFPVPLAIRGYLGFDAEQRCFASVRIDSAGQVQCQRFDMLPDGTQLQSSLPYGGLPMAQRSTFRVVGDQLLHTVDLLMPSGPALQVADGRFERVAAVQPEVLDAAPQPEAKPHAQMQRLARIAGTWEVTGTMAMLPGEPPTRITGTDVYRPIFGGTVLHARTDGTAEGMPGSYVAEAFWGWDPAKQCMATVFVSNMGEIGRMDSRFAADGKAIVSTAAATFQGEPIAQRFVLELDAAGAPQQAVAHALYGTQPPSETFRATYARRK